MLRLDRAQPVRVEVFDYLGRRVVNLHDAWLSAGGPHVFALDATGLSNGPYLIRATGPSFNATRPVIVVR